MIVFQSFSLSRVFGVRLFNVRNMHFLYGLVVDNLQEEN